MNEFGKKFKVWLDNLITRRDMFMIALGFLLAVILGYFIYQWRLWEATTLGNIMYERKVYDVILRVVK